LNFKTPRHVIIREEALDDVPQVLKEYGCDSLLIVSDVNVRMLYGVRIEQILLRMNIKPIFINVSTNDRPTLDKMHVELSTLDFDCVAGLGGGRPVDVGKYLAFKLEKPFISIPTSISHDGFASPIVALKDENGNPLSLFTAPPISVIVDLDVISQAPRRLLASGVGDLLGKITSVADARLAAREVGEHVPESALRMAEAAAHIVLENIESIVSFSKKSMTLLAEAGLLAGMSMSIAGSSRPCSGSEHLFSHAIDKLYPGRALHGEQVGVGTIIAAYLHGMDWIRIKQALNAVGAPTSIEDLHMTLDEAVTALLLAPRLRDRYTILHKLSLEDKELREIVLRTVSKAKHQ